MRRTIALLLGFLLAATLLAAQTSNQGGIAGTVTDPSGGVLIGATVTATNLETGVAHPATTNQVGVYIMSFLPPGNYSVAAAAKGFERTVIPGVVVTVGQRMNVNLKLRLGTSDQTVTVSAPAAVASLTTPTLSSVIPQDAINNLPLNGREWIQLAALVPGALSGNVKRGTHSDKGVEVSFNGARDTYNSFSIDGADSTDAYHNTLTSSPALDAIKEFRVETNMYSAQYGHAGGAAIQAVTNSGTNAFHSSIYEYHRNKALDALPPFANQTRAKMPNYLWNQFGQSIGGPIKKDKAFFFFTTEYFKEITPGSLMVSFAPTAAEAQGDVNGTINPWTNQPTILKNPFTGQVISSGVLPSNLVSPIGKTLMGIWAQNTPNYPDPFLNLHMFRGSTDTALKFMPRIDYNFNPSNSIFATFDYDYYDNGSVGNTVYGDENSQQHDRTATLNYSHIFSPTLLNNLVFSNTHYLAGSQFVFPNMGKKWGMYAPLNQNTPRILMYTQGYGTFSIGNDGPLYHKQNTNFAHDTLTWVKGSHILNLGGEFRHEAFLWTYDSGQTQDYFGLLDGYPGYSAYYGETGSTFTDLLTAMPNLMAIGEGGGGLMPFNRNALSGFVQDDWKVAPRLSLSLGLRYDYEAPFSIANGQMVTLDFTTGLPQYCAGASASALSVMKIQYETGGPCRDHNPDYKDFGPRLGFSYQPFANTVLRGGYGLFYTSENAYNTTYQGWVQPFGGLFDWYPGSAEWNPVIAPGNPLYDNQSHFTPLDQAPYGLSSVQGKSLGFFLPTTPHYPTGYVEQYNLTMDRDLGHKMVLDLGWVGSRGVNLNGPVTIQYYAPSLLPKIEAANPSLGNFGLRTKGFNSAYNALQASITKQAGHGLWFLANYSWSHSLTDMSNDDTNETLFTDVTAAGNIATRRWANADFNVPQHFSLSATWALPVGRGHEFGGNLNSAANAVLGGWTASSIVTVQSGVPFTVYTPSLYFPDRVCDGNLPASQRTATHWFNYNCFVPHTPTIITNPTTGRPETVNIQGNSAPNIIQGPGLNNWDLALQKNFNIAESYNLEFQGQFFNAFNHLNLQAPPGNYFFNTPSGAHITRAANLRDIQLGLTLSF